MNWRSAAGLAAGFLLSSGAFGAGKLPCEPSAECAFRLAREMTMEQAAKAKDIDSLQHWIEVTNWLEHVDPAPDAARARARFDVLLKQIRRVDDPDYGPLSEQWLASAMIRAGLVAEPEKLAAALPVENRDRIYRDLATEQARLGNWREAIRFLELMQDQDGRRPSEYQEVLKLVADAGRPEIIQQSASLMKKPPEFWVPIGLALADLAAGKEEEAVKRAKTYPDTAWRVWMLDALGRRYRDQKREADALRLDEIELDFARANLSKEWGEWLDEEHEWHFRRLVDAGEYSRALKCWPYLRKDERNPYGALTMLLMGLRRPEDIAAASKLLPQLSGYDLEMAQKGLAWSRVFAGLAEPKAALKELADPPGAGRHLVDWLGRDEYLNAVDADRARALLSASRELNAAYVNRYPVSDFYPMAVVKAQIRWGLLDDARKSLGEIREPRDRAEYLLRMSAAHSKLGQSARAQAAKEEGMAMLATPAEWREADYRADLLLRVGMLDEAERELRLIMKPEPLQPNFVRVAKPLLEQLIEHGEIDRAFRLAMDWSVFYGNDPEAVGTFYSVLSKAEAPPMHGPSMRQLRKLLKEAGGGD